MFKNFTPHPVSLILPSGDVITLAPEPVSARCSEAVEAVGFADSVPLIKKSLGEVTGLPEAEPGVWLITSLPVAQAAWAAGRRDVLAIGETVRDGQGRVIGARSLATAG